MGPDGSSERTERPGRQAGTWVAALLGAALALLPAGAGGAVHGARGTPLMAFTASGTAMATGPVHAVAQAADGTLVVGSGRLVVGDGSRWQEIAAPGLTRVRALAAEPAARDARVWVSGEGSTGFLARGADGVWSFTSLREQWPQGWAHEIGDPGAVAAVDGGAVWAGERRVVRWRQGRWEGWTWPGGAALTGFAEAGALWCYEPGSGLWRIEAEGEPQLVVASADLPGRPVTWLVAWPRRGAEGPDLMIGVRDRAYGRMRGARWEPLSLLSAALRDQAPVSALRLDDTHVAVATFKAGVVLAGAQGEVLGTIGTRNGLRDDRVHGLAVSGEQLWLGLEAGLVRIDRPGQVVFYDRFSGLGSGPPVRVVTHDGGVCVVTSSALLDAGPVEWRPRDYESKWVEIEAAGFATPELRPMLRESLGLTHATTTADGALWVSGFGGLWRVGQDAPEHAHVVAAEVGPLTRSHRVGHGVVFAQEKTLRALEAQPRGGWLPRDLGVELDSEPLSLVEQPDGALWVSVLGGGVRRLAWDEPDGGGAPRLRAEAAFAPGRGLPVGAAAVRLVQLAGRLFAFGETGILALAGDGRSFVPVRGLETYLGIAAARAETPGAGYWLVRARALGAEAPPTVLRVELRAETGGAEAPGGPLDWSPVDTCGLGVVGTPTSIDFVPALSGDTLWVTGTQGLLRLDCSGLGEPEAPPQPRLESVLVPGVGFLSLAPGATTPELPPAVHTVEFRFSVPGAAAGQAVHYQTRMEGVDAEWTSPAPAAVRTFSGLAPGQYAFALRAVDERGRASPETTYAFSLLAPWYQRAPALAGYIAAFVAVGATTMRWRSRRVHRRNELLDRLVAERTRELELSNTAKNEFLENISHEIRNPLNGLAGLMTLLREERLDPPERELVRSLRSVASTLQRVFDEVLAFSKLEYGCLAVRTEAFAPRAVLGDLVTFYAILATRQGCRIELDLAPELEAEWRGDADKLRTIVGNFLANALKYAPGGPVTVRGRRRATGGAASDQVAWLRVEVIDQGPGIAAEEQELLFRKFVRGRRARESDIPGTGLGLAACRMLAELLGGQVGLTSRPGAGSTFFVELPLQVAGAPGADAGAAMAVAGQGRALVVEDEPYNQLALAGMAREVGLAVEVASDADEARVWLKRQTFAVLFLDWELPGTKGGAIARWVRAQAGSEDLIILATTAHDSDEVRAHCQAAGMDGFLLKPFDAAMIAAELARVRHRRGAASAPVRRETIHARQEPAGIPALHPSHERPFGKGSDGSEGAAGDFAGAVGARPPVGRALQAAHVHVPAAPARGAPMLRVIEATQRELDRLLTAADEGDLETVAVAAHRMRGLTGLIGAATANTAAHRTELAARAGERGAELHATITALQAAIERLAQGAVSPVSGERG